MRIPALLASVLTMLVPVALYAQPGGSAKPEVAQTERARDALGRDTPRGTLLGFMRTFRESGGEAATVYLNTSLRGAAAADLARQLYVVLDSRLPARLHEVSDRPEGGLSNPLKPDQDIVGTISTAADPLDIVVERVNRGSAERVWLFSRRTLQAIPDVFDEIDLVSVDRLVPRPLTKTRIGGVRLFDWVALAVLVPLAYWLLGLFGRLIGRLLACLPAPTWVRTARQVLPGFIRLMLLAAAIRWLLTRVDLPLVERQFWYIATAMFMVFGFVWLLLLVNTSCERYYQARFRKSGRPEMTPLLRLVRRTADVIVLAVGGLLTLDYFGINPTAALAGLGIGGIAVALAAQKTLENVIGGLSIVFDKAVRVGDEVIVGDIRGWVDSIGLRSTRIRTRDRTVLGVPNGQIANVNIETVSARDKCWFHHFVSLRYGTTSDQMSAVLEGIRRTLTAHPLIDRTEPIRVQFCRLGPSSLDVEVSAYLRGTDWDAFLQTQQQLLMAIMGVVERAGTALALPAQTLHFVNGTKPSGTPPAVEKQLTTEGRTASSAALHATSP